MSGAEVMFASSIASTAMSFFGAISQGNAERAAYNRQAAIDERNRELANQDRIRSEQLSRQAAEDKRRENRRTMSALRAAYGSSGIEMAGTPLDILADASTEMALDERRIEDEGRVTNREYALKMLGLDESADMNRAAGKNAKKASIIKAGSTLLGNSQQIYDSGTKAGVI
ncbi:hypothetical protein EKK58_09300 [Candidatus Dependentiae bacterium]|nr:MAG: hypothetical protein EKK58_09300 [Candidatus Dependentiae bacterium]